MQHEEFGLLLSGTYKYEYWSQKEMRCRRANPNASAHDGVVAPAAPPIPVYNASQLFVHSAMEAPAQEHGGWLRGLPPTLLRLVEPQRPLPLPSELELNELLSACVAYGQPPCSNLHR